MKVEVDVLGSPSLILRMVSVDVKQHRISELRSCVKSRGGRSGLPSLILRMVSVDVKQHRISELRSLCESRGGRP